MTAQTKINIGTRLGSMLMDHFIMSMIAMVFFIPWFIGNFLNAFQVTHEPAASPFTGPSFYISITGFALYFCKDIINGRSIGKRITKTQVVDNHTGEVATPNQCLIRNLFCIIWPVEVIAILINPARRIGDKVAGTKIITYDPAHTVQPKFAMSQAVLPFIIAYGISLILLAATRQFEPGNNFIESSYNETESKALETMMADSLGAQVKASVKVYDKMKTGGLKYISVIYSLKTNYLADETSSRQLQQYANALLYSKYPRETFTGKAQYVFYAGSTMQITTNNIGTDKSKSGVFNRFSQRRPY